MRDFSHSKNITIFIKTCLEEAKVEMRQLSAISVSSGPGSYTGLRVGASAAKALCLSLNLPLIAVDSLSALSYGIDNDQKKDIVSLIDARRNDVYFAKFDFNKNFISEISLRTCDNVFLDNIKGSIICGNGCSKISQFTEDYYLELAHLEVQATFLRVPSFLKFDKKLFEDLVSFSPMYLGAPNITSPSKG